MSDAPVLSGPSAPPASGGSPRQLVILLHGWGADGANLIDLADVLGKGLPDAFFIAPNGPEVCEVNPYGFQWFSLMNREPSALLSGVRRAAAMLNPFIDAQLKALGLDDSKLALVGFSQGTMLALHVALRRPKPMAGLLGFSGALIGPETLPREIVSRPPVCLIHGQLDDVVPYGALAHAQAALSSAGLSVEAHTRPAIGHSIDMQGLEIAKKFLTPLMG